VAKAKNNTTAINAAAAAEALLAGLAAAAAAAEARDATEGDGGGMTPDDNPMLVDVGGRGLHHSSISFQPEPFM
jgi:hypothetical protein